MRVHKLQNVQKALDFLQKVKKIKLVNIRNDVIVDGNQKLILGLLWALILHFQVNSHKSALKFLINSANNRDIPMVLFDDLVVLVHTDIRGFAARRQPQPPHLPTGNLCQGHQRAAAALGSDGH